LEYTKWFVVPIWPTSITWGYNLHLDQEWFRKLQNLGLSKIYIERGTVEWTFLNYIFGLPLLELDDVEDYFVFDLIVDMPSKYLIIK